MKYIFENNKLMAVSTLNFYDLARGRMDMFSCICDYEKMRIREQQIENRKGKKLVLTKEKNNGLYKLYYVPFTIEVKPVINREEKTNL